MDFTKYFPELTANQIEQYEALQSLYTDWNAKINVISRKDTGEMEGLRRYSGVTGKR